MSLSGFMKQINKANQIISEKIGGAKGTEIDTDYQSLEKKTDVIYKLIDDVRDRTNEFLQPNPASRAKLWTQNNFSKMRGQVKNTPYPQPEGTLGETMIKYGKDLGDDSAFGLALNDMGESLRQMAGIKYALEDNIKQNFLDPLAQVKDNELKEVMHLRKKTENRRLDYDCKKRKKSQGSAITDEELQQAAEKFEESKGQTDQAMNRVLSNEAEHITHLIGFAEGFLEYHSQCFEILKDMVKQLNEKKKRLAAAPRNYDEPSMTKKPSYHGDVGMNGIDSSGFSASSQMASARASSNASSPASRFYDNGADTVSSKSDQVYQDNGARQPRVGPTTSAVQPHVSNPVSRSREPMCRGLYDFDAENSEELEFKEGSMIRLIARLDDNWLQGELNGRQGRFPVSYVEIVVPLP